MSTPRHPAIAATLIVIVLAITSLGLPAWPSTTADARADLTQSAPVAAVPVISISGDPTEDDLAIVDWAIERFVAAGLQLPDLEVSFPAQCAGKAGLYHVGRQLIEICRASKQLVLHELAHAWDDTASLDREGLLTEWGVTHWYQDDRDEAGRPGGEWLAMIVAWGLMDIDTTTSQSIDRDPASRVLPGLPNLNAAELDISFRSLTGHAALHTGDPLDARLRPTS